jgi:nucleotide-binding universal stress UspA family protein
MARLALPQHVIDAGIAELRAHAGDEAQIRAAGGARLAGSIGLYAEPRILPGASPWRTLREEAQRSRADVLVAGSRGAGPVERMMVGSTASSLIHHADRPVLVAPARIGATDAPLLLAWDGSPAARAAVHFAAAQLQARRLIVVHSWRSDVRHSLPGRAMLAASHTPLADYADAIDEIYADSAQERARQGVELAATLGLDAVARITEGNDDAWRELLRLAKCEGAAAVLAGTRGMGAVGRTVLGSVSSGLVHHAELPVIVVPDTSTSSLLPPLPRDTAAIGSAPARGS